MPTKLVSIQEMSSDKYDESLHQLIAGSRPLSSNRATECFQSQSLGFEIPSTKKYITES